MRSCGAQIPVQIHRHKGHLTCWGDGERCGWVRDGVYPEGCLHVQQQELQELEGDQ